jgi:hypothetical protein
MLLDESIEKEMEMKTITASSNDARTNDLAK